MSTPITDLPPCPCCKLPAHQFISILCHISYQCNNEKCEQFPATDYYERDQDARAEWQIIAAAAATEN